MPAGLDSNVRYESEVIGIDSSNPYTTENPESKDRDVQIFKATFWFLAEANIYTFYSPNDCYAGDPVAMKQAKSVRYLSLRTYSENWLGYNTNIYGPTPYFVSYSDYELSTPIAKGIDDFVGLDLTFDDNIPEDLAIGDGYSFETDVFKGVVTSVVIQSDKSELGNNAAYDDFFAVPDTTEVKTTDMAPESDDSVSVDFEGASSTSISGTNLYLSNLGIQVDDIVDHPTNEPAEYGQEGKVDKRDGDVHDDRFHLTLIPDITVYKETLAIKKCDCLNIDTDGKNAGISTTYTNSPVVPVSPSPSRVKGWHVQNKYAHLQFLIEVDVCSEVKIVYDATGDTDGLDNVPDAQLDDKYWDNWVNSDDVDIAIDSSNFFDKLANQFGFDRTTLIIVIGVAALACVLFILPSTPMGFVLLKKFDNNVGNNRSRKQ